MGCSGSSSNVIDSKRISNVSFTPTLPPSKPEERTKGSLIPLNMATNAVNILITCHTDRQVIAEQLQTRFANQRITSNILNESAPQSISNRANLIRCCDVFIVIISRMYQHTPFCMETIYYAKDLRKPIISIFGESKFQPYGGLGAITASSLRSISLENDSLSDNMMTELSNIIASEHKKIKSSKDNSNSVQIDNSRSVANFNRGNKQSTILICAVEDGLKIGQMIYQDFLKKNLNVAFEDLSRLNASCSIQFCSVLVSILSPQAEQSSICQAVLDEARRTRKRIVPVIAIDKWKPKEWLGLVIAGNVFFRMPNEKVAYEPFFDSNRMTDLRVEVEIACRPVPTQSEREQTEIRALKLKIEECKSQLHTWPPPRKTRNITSMGNRQPVRAAIPEPSAKLRFSHIHHSITRLDMKAPPPMLNEYGLPKRVQLDCMISYQWDYQSLVRKFYEDLLMREVSAWFDIWGSMQGNINEAMATGVECAKVLIIFLSKGYVESANCLLEFRYAVKRGKAFVVIRTEPNIQIEPWMAEALSGFPQYEIFSYQALEALINNVPTIDVIVQATRILAQAQPPDIVDDCSSELFEIRCLLDDARDAIYAQAGETRFKTCTRCNQQFDADTKGGCKNHRAYYMGGTILEGRWVCCRQQAKDSPGCSSCDHTDAARKFLQDPRYGTWTWEPA